jgi:hypothetical protein
MVFFMAQAMKYQEEQHSKLRDIVPRKALGMAMLNEVLLAGVVSSLGNERETLAHLNKLL